MTSLTDALSLYDTASKIDRLQFQLRAMPPAPAILPLADVSAQVRALAGITAEISDEVTRRLSDGPLSKPTQRAVEAYSSALAPLGEASTELGRLHREVAFCVNIATHGPSRSVLNYPQRLTDEVIAGCLEAADEVLGVAAEALRAAATHLAPSSPSVQNATRVRSPHAPTTGQSSPAAPSSPALPATAPRTAKGR